MALVFASATVATPAEAASKCTPSWATQAVPSPSNGFPSDGTALSPSDAWIVSAQNVGLNATIVHHWDGTSWTRTPSPSPSGGTRLVGVAAATSSDAWAVGVSMLSSVSQPLIEHWDGSSWQTFASPSAGFYGLNAVAAVSSADVWAVGGMSSSQNETSNPPLIEHWDGLQWSIVPTGFQNSTFYETLAFSGTDVWAFGRQYSAHWNGLFWQTVPVAGNQATGTGPNDIWLLDSRAQTVQHWDGASWNNVALPFAPGHNQVNQYLVWGLAELAPADVWFFGDSNGATPLLEHFDGTSVAVVPTTGFGSKRERLTGGFAAAPSRLFGYGLVPMGGGSTAQPLFVQLCPSLVTASGFSIPKVALTLQGQEVSWSMPLSNSGAHQVRDASGMGLFDSGLRAPGASFVTTFPSAGTYPVVDPVTNASSSVAVPVVGKLVSAAIAVTWSAAAPPSGFVFDVQVQRPHQTGFAAWQVGTSAQSATFTPDAGSGTYSFRALLRNAGNGSASGWSPLKRVVVP
jgi:hypothetical protein